MKSPAAFVPHSLSCALCSLSLFQMQIPAVHYDTQTTITRRPCAPHSHVTAGLLTRARILSPGDLVTCHEATLPLPLMPIARICARLILPVYRWRGRSSMEQWNKVSSSACSWEQIESTFFTSTYTSSSPAQESGAPSILKGSGEGVEIFGLNTLLIIAMIHHKD